MSRRLILIIRVRHGDDDDLNQVYENWIRRTTGQKWPLNIAWWTCWGEFVATSPKVDLLVRICHSVAGSVLAGNGDKCVMRPTPMTRAVCRKRAAMNCSTMTGKAWPPRTGSGLSRPRVVTTREDGWPPSLQLRGTVRASKGMKSRQSA